MGMEISGVCTQNLARQVLRANDLFKESGHMDAAGLDDSDAYSLEDASDSISGISGGASSDSNSNNSSIPAGCLWLHQVFGFQLPMQRLVKLYRTSML